MISESSTSAYSVSKYVNHESLKLQGAKLTCSSSTDAANIRPRNNQQMHTTYQNKQYSPSSLAICVDFTIPNRLCGSRDFYVCRVPEVKSTSGQIINGKLAISYQSHDPVCYLFLHRSPAPYLQVYRTPNSSVYFIPRLKMSYYFTILSPSDAPLFNIAFGTSKSGGDGIARFRFPDSAQYMNQFVIHSSLDIVEEAQWMNGNMYDSLHPTYFTSPLLRSPPHHPTQPIHCLD